SRRGGRTCSTPSCAAPSPRVARELAVCLVAKGDFGLTVRRTIKNWNDPNLGCINATKTPTVPVSIGSNHLDLDRSVIWLRRRNENASRSKFRCRVAP
ncbi:MAG: hypothetical protein R3B99_38105, partial [Polyangiales bacterium]